MPRQIPETLVKEYIVLDAKIDRLKAELEDRKKQLRAYHKRGFVSDALNFIDKKVQRIEWKTLVAELTARFMKPAAARVFYSSLNNRFKRKPIASEIQIVGKPRKRHAEVEIA